MKTIDFARSFLTFRIDTLKKPSLTTSHKPPYTLNSSRIQLECCCEVTDKRTGTIQQFVLGASCKTELVGVERGLWTEPNADFVPILSGDRFLNLKTFDRADRQVMFYPPSMGLQPERQTGKVADAFDRISIDICGCEGEVLETADDIIETILANRPVVAQTEIEEERYSVLIEYPVKTMNVNERDTVYQTDTGPILFPDLSREPEDQISGLELAFAAFNCPQWTEFILRAKSPVAEGVNVYHYCKPVRFDCKNRVIRLGC